MTTQKQRQGANFTGSFTKSSTFLRNASDVHETVGLEKRYKVLIIDPPWNQGKTGKRKARPNQTTTPILKIALDLMAAWGFTFYTMITWNKRTGPCPFGPYQVTTEYVIFGYKGKAVFPRACLGKMQTCFTETPTIHSAKPDSFYQEIARHFEGPRLDVFARQVRDGYDGWGNEYGSLTTNAKRQGGFRYAKNHENHLQAR